MTVRQLVEMAVAYAGISNAELARRLGWSQQLLNKRMNTGKFSMEDWENVAEALGAKAKICFVFPDGKEV
ncbi:winged helix-turn-helix domain-containing protein [Anaerotruncus colihominis]|jgi:hypothetical protein|uniref:helix-turn-helix domain-containing protein n=1 Tax=Anaerotruncus TaxID=244127 RepID=UPI00189CD39E|nr:MULTISPECIES: winged helix-turn-helix domain-containing protein [Anaerotruncus]MCI8494004.1 helix-turn-helix domain-containing protein [Anaerotruncus sp.]DAI28749.1 MAG TPA: Regulatory protein [Caudoviricetes sp.]